MKAMNGIDDDTEELTRPFEIIEQFLQNAPTDWEDDPILDIPGVGAISHSEASVQIIPSVLFKIGNSKHPEKNAILLRVLKQPSYDEEGRYPIHEIVLEILRSCNQNDTIEGIVEWFNTLSYDFDAYGCRDVRFWIQNTSNEALEIALEICAKHCRKEIIPQLESFMQILPWTHSWSPAGTLGELGVRYYAQLEGVDAFDLLIERLIWTHPKWDCGEEIDGRVADAIVSIGKEVVPLLKPYLNSESDINEGIVWILEQLGEKPSDYYNHHK